jgi:DNA-binding transcriptional regulator YiaG
MKYNGDWQSQRRMTATQFKRICIELEISRAAAGRYIGVSLRRLRRITKGQSEVPESAALLLRSLVAHNEKPLVPKWRQE